MQTCADPYLPSHSDAPSEMLAHYQIIRRNGSAVPFEPLKIAAAMRKAFLAVHGDWSSLSQSEIVFLRAEPFATFVGRFVDGMTPRAVLKRHQGRKVIPAVLGFFGVSKSNMRNAP